MQFYQQRQFFNFWTYHFLVFFFLLFSLIPLKKAVPSPPCHCRDGKENLAEAHSDPKSHFPVIIKRLRGTLYRPNGAPACYNGRPTVLMPGIVKLFDGELLVPNDHPYDLLKSATMRMTVHSPNFDEPICVNGTSQYAFMPNSLCNFDLCEFIGKDLCEFLQRPGTHTIKEMEQKLHFNSTLLLPEPPSILGISLLDLLSGEFNFVMALETAGETILELKIPTNEEYLQIGVDSSGNEDDDNNNNTTISTEN